jgi:GH24 family phage-related lysozyme (muramidase)
MPSFRIPGPLCGSTTTLFDDGLLALRPAPSPQPLCLQSTATPPREWHLQSRSGGFPASTLTMSPDATTLLQAIETLRLRPYDDQTGRTITAWVKGATIGYGHLIAQPEWDTYKDGITPQDAEALFRADARPFETVVGQTITVSLQQYQFDALVILAFNIGKSGFRNSAVATLVNEPAAKTAYASLESAWKAWNKSQGQVMQGLSNRRAAEWRIYTEATYARW